MHTSRFLLVAVVFLAGSTGWADTIHLSNGQVIREVQITNQSPTEVEYLENSGESPKRLAKKTIRRLEYGEVDWEAKRILSLRLKVQAMRQRLEELRKAALEDPEAVIQTQNDRLSKLPSESMSRLAESEKARKEQSDLLRDLDQRLRQANAGERPALLKQRAQLRARQIRSLRDSQATLTAALDEFQKQRDALAEIRLELERARQILQKQKHTQVSAGEMNTLERQLAAGESAHERDLAAQRYRGALWRSFVLPGWGQLYQEQVWRGRAFLGLFGLALWNNWHTRSLSQTARAEYRDPAPAALFLTNTTTAAAGAAFYAQRANTYQKRNADFNQSLLLTGAVWLVSLGDTALYVQALPGPKTAKANSSTWQIGWQGIWEPGARR